MDLKIVKKYFKVFLYNHRRRSMSLRLNFFWFTSIELDVSVDDSDTLTKRVLKISCKTYISRRRNRPFL